MKEQYRSTCKDLRRFARQFSVTLVVLVGWGLNGGEVSDLKSFRQTENYIVEGASVVLTQEVGEATAKVGQALKDTSTLSAPNGGKFDLQRQLPSGINIYQMQSAGTLSDADRSGWIDSLNQDANVEYAYPVFGNAATGLRHFLNDELVVRLKAAFDPGQNDLATTSDVELIETLNAKENIYVFRLSQPKNLNPFAVCRALLERAEVVWAEPNMGQEVRQFVIPNDPSFGSEWSLRNTGQTSAFSDADVDADDAWDGSQGYGSPGIRVAILDDGVQTDHPDLQANIVAGYDFYSGDSDPNPSGTYDNHGTAVAGMAAAAANNSTGIAGVAGKCTILPVRIMNSIDANGNAVIASATSVYRALIYAAENADVISCSWGTSPSSTISSGFSYAYREGRAGRGCAALCASGNAAGGQKDATGDNSYGTRWQINLLNQFGAGSYYIAFAYVKDGGGSANDDCFWIADVTMPDGTSRRFDAAALPADWISDGDGVWTGSVDPIHAHGTSRFAWRSGAIGNSQFSRLRTVLPVTINAIQNSIYYRGWVSTEDQHDFALVVIYNAQGAPLSPQFLVGKGSGAVANRTTAVSYPANLSYVLAVGASSDFDYRSHYSQYDSVLDFVAPSSGGYGNITTTDRTGSAGYDTTSDYTSTFGGTSASAPLAAGIAALALSKNGNQTRATVANTLIQNCDKIGPVAYTGSPSRNDYYGYGRLNARLVVNATSADTTAPTFSSATVMNYRMVDVAFSEPMGEGATTAGNYTLTAGRETLSPNPAKVIRITPSVYRLVWTSGDMAISGTVTVQASSSIKDVAGNALTTTSQSSTGTKRVIGINCGNTFVSDGYELMYAPPFVSDNGFQGNEPAPYLTSVSGPYSTPGSVDTSFVSSPAPQAVYQTIRDQWGSSNPTTYSIPVPAGTYKVRLHFAEIYFLGHSGNIGKQVFDIKVNGVLKYSGFDILFWTGDNDHRAYIYEIPNITSSGTIDVELDPHQAQDGTYRAAINGIEIVKP
jgi:subtilisin family serine protease